MVPITAAGTCTPKSKYIMIKKNKTHFEEKDRKGYGMLRLADKMEWVGYFDNPLNRRINREI
jgi:hypothetical protein